MKAVFAHRGIRWLALLGYALVATLFGNGLVLCQGADGHVAIEPFHDSCCPVGDPLLAPNSSDIVSGGCCTDSIVTTDQVLEGRDRSAADGTAIVAPLLPILVAVTELVSTPSIRLADHPPDALSVAALSLRSVRLLV